MRTDFQEQSLRETVTFEEMITSKDKYMSIFLRQMEKMITNDHILAAHGMFTFRCCLVQLHEQTNMSLFLNNS